MLNLLPSNERYRGKEVYVKEWYRFLSGFNVLTETSNLSITAVDSTEVESPYIEFQPVYLSITFNCNHKMALHLKELIKNVTNNKKIIGVVDSISVGFASCNYSSFFITDIVVDTINVFGNNISMYESYKVEVKGYTLYRTTN